MTPQASGEESCVIAVAPQAIEALPSFGQIKPMRGRVVRGPNNSLQETWRRARASRKRFGFPGEEKAVLYRKKAAFASTAERAMKLDGATSSSAGAHSERRSNEALGATR
jgi:hypothetical protein